jgi:exodeoxyribonuclease-3
MRIVALNVNGIRSAERKGLVRWLSRIEPWDVVPAGDQGPPRRCAEGAAGAAKSHAAFHHAQKGLQRRRLVRPPRGAGARGFGSNEFDAEGRYLEADFGKLTVISVYLPSGSSSPDRQLAKFRFLAQFLPHLERLRDAGREVILCGDWNIAHQPIDLKNWRSNQKNSGFLPEERAWLTRVFDELGFVDVFRRINREPDQYTWWSNRGQAWAKNVGWRIDYQIATAGIAATARTAAIYTNRRFPITLR